MMKGIIAVVLAFNCFVVYAQQNFEYLDSLAFDYLENSDYAGAEKIALETIELSKNDSASIYQINAYTILGILNKNRGFYYSSVENYLNALSYAEKIGDKARESACLNNIGIVYKLQKKYFEAIDYFEKSLDLEERLDNDLQKSIRLYNMADSYLELDSLSLALSFFTNSLIIEQKNDNMEGALYANIGIGNVYLRRKDYVNLGYLLEDLGNNLEGVSLELKVAYMELFAQYFLGEGNLAAADEQIDSALLITDSYDLSYLEPNLLLVKIAIQEERNNWQQVAAIYKRYVVLTERLNSEEINRRIDELNYNYQLQKKQFEIEKLQQEKKLEEIKREKSESLRLLERRLIVYILLVIVFISVLIVISLKKISRFSK